MHVLKSLEHKEAGSPSYCYDVGFPGGLTVENLPTTQQPQAIWDWSLGQEDPLEEVMVTHSSILTWRIPWTKEPDGLQSMGSQRNGHDCSTEHHQYYYWKQQLTNS